MIAYNDAKLCNVLFTRGLAKVSDGYGSMRPIYNVLSFTDLCFNLQRWCHKGICVYAVHPGNMVSTNLTRNYWFYRVIFAFVRPFTKSLVRVEYMN